MDKSRQGGLRILFADDEAHLRDLMQMELPRMGHEVTICPDGSAAIKAMEKGPYDAALLDLKMPGLTGIEVLENQSILSDACLLAQLLYGLQVDAAGVAGACAGMWTQDWAQAQVERANADR